jgi:uncharacterized membrane protein
MVYSIDIPIHRRLLPIWFIITKSPALPNIILEVRMENRKDAIAKNIRGKDQKVDIFKIFAYFLICGFIGWIFETMAVWIGTGRLTDRGFFFVMEPFSHYLPFLQGIPILQDIPLIWGLPFIDIYGIGGLIICIFFKHWQDHPVKLFFIGMVILTLAELLASYTSEWVVQKQYWDYSGDLFNFDGRICLRSSLAWGVLSVVCVKWVAPVIDKIYGNFAERKYFRVVVVLLMCYVVICALTKYIIDPTIIAN